MMKHFGTMLLAAALATLAGCSGANAPASQAASEKSAAPAPAPAAPVTIKMGHIGTLSDSGIFLALERGYFKEQNLDVQLQKFTTGGDQIPLLANGQLQIGSGSVNPGLFNAVAQGLPLKLVADKGALSSGFGFNTFVVRKDLIESGAVKEAKDLKGKTVGLDSLKAGVLIELEALLKSGGLTVKDVNIVTIAFPDLPAAFANKKVDAAVVVEPFATVSENQGSGKIFTTFDKLLPDFQIAAVFYSQDFATRQKDVATRWMVAYMKGVQDYNDALKDPAKKKELATVLSKYTAVKDPALYDRMVFPGLNPKGYLNLKSLTEQQDFWKNHGDLAKTSPVEQAVDHSFVDAALKQLGK